LRDAVFDARRLGAPPAERPLRRAAGSQQQAQHGAVVRHRHGQAAARRGRHPQDHPAHDFERAQRRQQRA